VAPAPPGADGTDAKANDPDNTTIASAEQILRNIQTLLLCILSARTCGLPHQTVVKMRPGAIKLLRDRREADRQGVILRSPFGPATGQATTWLPSCEAIDEVQSMARKKKEGQPATEDSHTREQRVVAFAEQLGRMVGTVERKTTGWLDLAALSDQVTRIRDGAADLLSHLGSGDSTSQQAPTTPSGSIADSLPPDGGAADSEARPKARTRKAASPRVAKAQSESTRVRSRERVAAPGKAHRKRPTSVAGAKHSNEEIAKVAATDRTRRTRGR
jgi:hypothetical protein